MAVSPRKRSLTLNQQPWSISLAFKFQQCVAWLHFSRSFKIFQDVSKENLQPHWLHQKVDSSEASRTICDVGSKPCHSAGPNPNDGHMGPTKTWKSGMKWMKHFESLMDGEPILMQWLSGIATVGRFLKHNDMISKCAGKIGAWTKQPKSIIAPSCRVRGRAQKQKSGNGIGRPVLDLEGNSEISKIHPSGLWETSSEIQPIIGAYLIIPASHSSTELPTSTKSVTSSQ